MITYTDAQLGRINDRLNNARQLVQALRSGMYYTSIKSKALVDEIHRMLGECAEAINAGTMEADDGR